MTFDLAMNTIRVKTHGAISRLMDDLNSIADEAVALDVPALTEAERACIVEWAGLTSNLVDVLRDTTRAL